MDNGNLRLWRFRKAVILEIYAAEVLTLADIDSVLVKLQRMSRPPFLIIIVRTGNYRLSIRAKIRLRKEDRNLFKIAYVVKGLDNMRHAASASRSYLKHKDVYICDSIDSAYKALTRKI